MAADEVAVVHDDDPVAEGLLALDVWLADLNQQLPRLLDGARLTDTGQPEQLLPVLAKLREQRQLLGSLEALLERDVAAALGTGKKTVAGMQVEVHGGWKRTDWSDHEVARQLVERSLVDANGEMDEAAVEVAMAAARLVLGAGRMAWRVTDLRAAGVDPGEVSKEEPKRMTVQILVAAEVAQ